MLRRLFRSEIHATVCTFRGWTANNAATNALGHGRKVVPAKSQNNSSTLRTWRARFIP